MDLLWDSERLGEPNGADGRRLAPLGVANDGMVNLRRSGGSFFVELAVVCAYIRFR